MASTASANDNNRARSSTAITAILFSVPVLVSLYQRQQRQQRRSSFDPDTATLRALGDRTVVPPLPRVVQRSLSNARLAYLSTVDADASSSHLSLMRFTYLRDREVIVMSTNRRTKKFEMLRRQRGVALLIHDFGSGNGNGNGKGIDGDGDVEDEEGGRYSVTLNGECRIETGETAEFYRNAHLKHNPDYPQFIVGDDIAILCVRVTSARICNVNDQVQTWNLGDAATAR